MKYVRDLVVFFAVLVFTIPVAANDSPIESLTRRFCAKCHSGDEPKGDVRLDNFNADSLDDGDRIESIIRVLANKEMPPKKSTQPTDELRGSAIAFLKAKVVGKDHPSRLKRLTRDEYTNTINDLSNIIFLDQ